MRSSQPIDCLLRRCLYLPSRIAATAMPIQSPCNKICTIDPATDLCVGCGRTLDEIARWSSLTDAERARIMVELPRRVAARAGAIEPA
jgi:predicted Fe-S protein YdhL (DUF1289 family)